MNREGKKKYEKEEKTDVILHYLFK